jgi:hypothetical protein
MIAISEDNIKIYQLLEKAEELLTDFSMDKVIAFDHEEDFHIVIYLAGDRNFISFTARNYLQDTNAFPELINSVQEYSNSKIHISLLEQSVRFTEHKMHSKNNSRFFFDAH